MNEMWLDRHRRILTLLVILSCGWLTGCCTDMAKSISQIHEVMTPQYIIKADDGTIAVKVNCSYYSREQYDDKESPPLAEYGSRGRILLIDSRWIDGRVQRFAAGRTVPIDLIIIEFPSEETRPLPEVQRIIPNSFLDPGVESYRMSDARQYRMDQLVPYKNQNGTVYLSFAKTRVNSHRAQMRWWADFVVMPAMAADAVLKAAAVAVAFPVAVVVVPVGFVVIGVMYAMDGT